MAKIEVTAVGGYDFVGKNMTAVKIDDEIIIFDMGLHLDNYIKCQSEEDENYISTKILKTADAIPDDSSIEDWRGNVKAIVTTHAHLDHLGAIPYLASRYNCPVIGTPFTIEVLNAIAKDNGIVMSNDLKKIAANQKFKISGNLELEFINVTHSTPQTVLAAIHTKHEVIVYANDFKFDMYPTLGKKTEFSRFEKLGKVKLLIVDSLYAQDSIKMPSESVAKQMLKDVMVGISSKGQGMVVTTFSSHLARLDSIYNFAKEIGRKPIFLGWSLSKYIEAGEKVNIINFSKDSEITKFKNQVKKTLKTIYKEKDKYVLICTGHQGEPSSIMDQLVNDKFDYKLDKNDIVIFSCNVIPSEINLKNREVMDKKIMDKGCRMFKGIHVSGHGAKEDLRDLLNMIKPDNIVPTHGGFDMKMALAGLAKDMGYKLGKNVFVMKDGERVEVK